MTKNLSDLRIVTIGGGTGGFAVNSGLKLYPVKPTAICTVFDSGGSTGELRDEFGALPQGDIRRCLLALADDDQHILRELFTYRFQNSNGTSAISKHSLGNLMLLSAEQLWGPITGTRNISKLLGIRGEVLPISIDDAHLCARLCDGSILKGEKVIDTRALSDERTISKVWLEPMAIVCREAADAIVEADVVVFGPGDLYTSIIPNLLVEGVVEALSRSKAKLVYVANLMTKWQETRDFTAARFLAEMCAYGIGREKFDAVLINSEPIAPALCELYAHKDKSTPVVLSDGDEAALSQYTHAVVAHNFLSKSGLHQQLVRHDSRTLAHDIVALARGGAP